MSFPSYQPKRGVLGNTNMNKAWSLLLKDLLNPISLFSYEYITDKKIKGKAKEVQKRADNLQVYGQGWYARGHIGGGRMFGEEKE